MHWGFLAPGGGDEEREPAAVNATADHQRGSLGTGASLICSVIHNDMAPFLASSPTFRVLDHLPVFIIGSRGLRAQRTVQQTYIEHDEKALNPNVFVKCPGLGDTRDHP